MHTISVTCPDSDLSYATASRLAREAASQHRMQDPTIVAWHHRSSDAMSPAYQGANPDSWWEKFGEGNGGQLEIQVGDDYEFVMMDSLGYECHDKIPLRNLEDCDGREYICFAPMLGGTCEPKREACVPLDEWTANQY